MGGYQTCPLSSLYCDKYNSCNDCLDSEIEWELIDGDSDTVINCQGEAKNAV